MTEQTNDTLSRLLRASAEEKNASVPFDALRDRILLEEKRRKRQKLRHIRMACAAASFVVLLGVGALFMNSRGYFGVSNDTAESTSVMLTGSAPEETAYAEAAPKETEGSAAVTAEVYVPQTEPDSSAVTSDSPEESEAESGDATASVREEASSESDMSVLVVGSGYSAEGTPAEAELLSFRDQADFVFFGTYEGTANGEYRVAQTEMLCGTVPGETVFPSLPDCTENGEYLIFAAEGPKYESDERSMMLVAIYPVKGNCITVGDEDLSREEAESLLSTTN